MNISTKKYIFINTLIIFSLSFITHQLYEWLPSFMTSIFFPVNEAIWEHMKMIFSSYMLFQIIEYFILKKEHKEETQNILSANLITAIFNIVLFLLVYLPIYNNFGHNLIITLIIYLITIFISQILNYVLLVNLNSSTKYQKILVLVFIIAIYGLFTYLTYHPIKTSLFYDSENNVYGIKKDQS